MYYDKFVQIHGYFINVRKILYINEMLPNYIAIHFDKDLTIAIQDTMENIQDIILNS